MAEPRNIRSLVGTLAFSFLLPCQCSCWAQNTNFSVLPSADTFVRASDPTSNFGAAGALAVSGAAATNFIAQNNGIFDTLVRFSTAEAKSAFDSTLGTNSWFITNLAVRLQETATPSNPIFNYGVGAFEIRWIASDTWVEGTGRPKATTTDGVTYQDLPSVLNPQRDVSLGRFTNSGANQLLTFTLPLAQVLISNITVGAQLSFYMAPISPKVGFTFNSRDYSFPDSRPALQIAASALPPPLKPTIQAITTEVSNQVAIHFLASSNLTYQLQSARGLPSNSNGGWTTIFTEPPATTNRDLTVFDAATNPQTFYRLLVSP